MTSGPVREAVGLFKDEPSLQAVVDELLISGFDRSDISVVAGRRSVERRFGAMYDDVTDLEDAPDAPVTAYVGCDSRTGAKAAVVGGMSYCLSFMNKIEYKAHERAGFFEIMPAALKGKGA